MGLADGGGGHLAQAQGAHLARAHQVAQGTHAVLDGHLLVPAVQVVQVDAVRLQPAQAVFAVAAQGLGAPVDDAFDAIVELHTTHAALAGQREAAAVGTQHAAHQGFVGAEAIECRRVEQRDTGIQRAQQHALGICGGRGNAIGVAQVHAAEANAADGKRPQGSGLHARVVPDQKSIRRVTCYIPRLARGLRGAARLRSATARCGGRAAPRFPAGFAGSRR